MGKLRKFTCSVNKKLYKSKSLKFTNYEKDIYSQYGQDGVLEELLSLITNIDRLITFEVGGWDGVTLSNTCNLLRNFKSTSIFIEANRDKYNCLLENHKKELNSGKVFAFNEFLTPKGYSSPSSFLKRSGLKHVDLMSIDVDGMDYYIFRDLDISPKVVLIEFNPTFHPDVDFIQPENYKYNWGSSSNAIIKLAKNKGYNLVHYFDTDLLFVRDDLIKKFNLHIIQDKEVFNKAQGYVGFGYDGTMFLIGNGKKNGPYCPWEDGVDLKSTKIQILPSFLRFFVSKKNILEYIKWTLRQIYLLNFRNIYLRLNEKFFKIKKK